MTLEIGKVGLERLRALENKEIERGGLDVDVVKEVDVKSGSDKEVWRDSGRWRMKVVGRGRWNEEVMRKCEVIRRFITILLIKDVTTREFDENGAKVWSVSYLGILSLITSHLTGDV